MYNNDNYQNSNSLFGTGNQNNNLSSENNISNQQAGIFDNAVNNTGAVDVPPELSEIKNLSDASIATAPTMDVLGPMNIMPNTLPEKNDRLDEYERGNVPINNQDSGQSNINSFQNQNNIGINNNISGNITNTQNSFQPVNQSMNNYSQNGFQPVNQPINNPINNFNQKNSYISEGQINGPQLDNPNQFINQNISSNVIPNSNNQINNNLNNEYNLNPEFNNFNQNNSYINEGQINGPQLNNSNQFINQDLNNSINDLSALSVNNDIESNNIENTDTLTSKEIDATSDSNPVNNDVDNSNNNINEPEAAKNDYDIVQDENLGEPELKEGLDESYTEPDVLEIMDLDTKEETLDEVQEKEEHQDNVEQDSNSKIDKPLIKTAVDKIKELVEELKESGIDIEIDEFDFEELFQLVVKLKK
ncbi:MAG: hypothetical protein IJ094_07265 [Bacilli bacterium]|nr:hypothetical protein [Bacilli bacterium]